MICTVPRVAVDGRRPAGASRPSLYGHGLLGGAGEVGGGNVQAMGNEHNFVFCATDWIGMSTYDVPNVADAAPGPVELQHAASTAPSRAT